MTTGWRDTLTLGIASAGLVAVGPMQLFTPPQALELWRSWVWLMLIGLALGLTLVLLSGKPRLIAYGLDAAQFREILTQAALKVDQEAQWSSNVLSLPIQWHSTGNGSDWFTTGSSSFPCRHVAQFGALDDARAQVCTVGWASRLSTILGGLAIVVSWVCTAALSSIIPLIQHPADALTQLQKFLAR